jgi:hypothetical protein
MTCDIKFRMPGLLIGNRRDLPPFWSSQRVKFPVSVNLPGTGVSSVLSKSQPTGQQNADQEI